MSTSMTVELPDSEMEGKSGRIFTAGPASVHSSFTNYSQPVTINITSRSESVLTSISLSLTVEDAMSLGLALLAAAGDSADRDPYATAKVGDPDLQPHLDTHCGALQNEWICTRSVGHPGQHVATDGLHVKAVWSASASCCGEPGRMSKPKKDKTVAQATADSVRYQAQARGVSPEQVWHEENAKAADNAKKRGQQ
jgi:hypothetical protein